MPDQAAEAFVGDPGVWADPGLAAQLIASGIASGLRPETAQRLLTSPRLAGRPSRWLAEHLGGGDPAALEPVDLALASASGAVFESVALCAGAVWHAQRVRALMLGADIALLRARFGDATRNAALRYAALAPDDGRSSGSGPGVGDDAGALADAIERDGARCISAWIDVLPGWAAARVRLKWAGTMELPAGTDGPASAVRIVRTLAAEALVT
jgi:hypothetical protein